MCETEFYRPQVKICEMANSSLTAVLRYCFSESFTIADQLGRQIDLVRLNRLELKLF